MLAVCESAPSLYVTEEGRKGTRETECCCDRKMDRFLGSIPVPLGSSPDYNFLQYTFQYLRNGNDIHPLDRCAKIKLLYEYISRVLVQGKSLGL